MYIKVMLNKWQQKDVFQYSKSHNIHDTTFRAAVCSNRWREPIWNLHSLKIGIQLVAANGCAESCIVAQRCVYIETD